MKPKEAKVGTRVRAVRDYAGVPRGTEGVIDEDTGSGVNVAWDLKGNPLPTGYSKYDGRPNIETGIIRESFDKKFDLHILEVVPGWEIQKRLSMESISKYLKGRQLDRQGK
jgi:hypothetical protein